MKKYFTITGSGNAEKPSADRPIRRQDESADTDNQRILTHRGAKFSFAPGRRIPSLRHCGRALWPTDRVALK